VAMNKDPSASTPVTSGFLGRFNVCMATLYMNK